MPRFAILFVLFFLLSAKPSAAIEQQQIDQIDRLAAATPAGQSVSAFLARHYAVLLWVEDYCDGRSDEGVRSHLADRGKADPDGFESGWMDALDLLNKTNPQSMCALAAELYGQEGRQIRGGWSKKR